MKHSVLHGLGHNLADSLASGCSLLVGAYDIPLKSYAIMNSPHGVVLDFLSGKMLASHRHDGIEFAVRSLSEQLP